jgi:hypothetical protein
MDNIISYASSCITCLVLGLLIPLYFKKQPTERSVPPSAHQHQFIMMDMRAKEDLERRVGPLTLSQAIHFLRYEDEHDCLLFSIPVSDTEPDDSEEAQRRLKDVKQRYSTGSLTEFPDDHMSDGETA